MADIKDFLNSKSMLTPGISGAITMLIANALYQQFALPQRWVGLVLSFVLGALVFSDKATVVWQKVIFYVLNSLIIFAMAMGANAAGAAATAGPSTGSHFDVEVNGQPSDGSFFTEWQL